MVDGWARPYGISWSPDSRWLVFGQESDNSYTQLHLYEVKSKRRIEVSGEFKMIKDSLDEDPRFAGRRRPLA